MSNRGGAEDFEEYYGPDEAPMTAVVMFTPGSGASSVMGSRPSSAASSVVHATTRLVRGGVGGVGGDMNAAGSSLTSEPSLGEVSGRSSAQSHLGFVNEYYRGTAAWSAGIAGESVTLDPRNPTTTTQTTASSGGHHGVVADARRVPWNSPLVVRIGREMDTPRNGIPLYTDYIAVAWVDFSSLPPLRAGGGDLATAAAIIGTRPPSPSSGPKQRGPAAQRATASPALPYRTSATPTILPPFSVGGGSGSLQFAAAEDDFSSESAALTSTSRAGGLAHFGPGNVLMQLFIVRRYCWASFKLSASHQMSRLCQKAADDASNNVQRVPPHHHTSPPSASSSSILACAQTAEATAVGAPLPAFTNDSFDADVSHHNAHAASTTSSTTTTTTTPPLNLHATVTPPLPPPSIHLPPSQGGTTTHSGTSGSNSRSTSSSGEKQPGTGAPTTPAVVGGPSSAAPFTRVGSDPKWSVQSTSSRSSAVPPRSATTVTPPSHVASNSTDHHASASLPPVPVEAASRSPTTEGVSTASNQSKATPPFFPRGGDGPIVVTLSEPSTVAARARKNRGRRSSGDKKILPPQRQRPCRRCRRRSKNRRTPPPRGHVTRWGFPIVAMMGYPCRLRRPPPPPRRPQTVGTRHKMMMRSKAKRTWVVRKQHVTRASMAPKTTMAKTTAGDANMASRRVPHLPLFLRFQRRHSRPQTAARERPGSHLRVPQAGHTAPYKWMTLMATAKPAPRCYSARPRQSRRRRRGT